MISHLSGPWEEQENRRMVTREEFNQAVEAVWSEINYQNNLPRRINDEAKEPAGFATLTRVYLRRLEDTWADNAGTEASLPFLRKIAGDHDSRDDLLWDSISGLSSKERT